MHARDVWRWFAAIPGRVRRRLNEPSAERADVEEQLRAMRREREEVEARRRRLRARVDLQRRRQ